ncbi:uncharacterized protein LOC127792554 [Diospyros lotus]|uniref:uncharacterized protein LOC127792554 n=1 Tax=Diospyros lotus TaxID=55363 RepID=UPI0022526306|nr:uncharacterized protein LOC127792554 [Diospyros lotus]
MNKNKRVAALKNDDRLEVTFYKNRAVGPNHEAFSRHLGRIVRDFNICSVRVHSWKEIGEQEKSHMWAAIKEKFKNDNMEDHRKDALCHMRSLWNNWRSLLNRKYIKPYNSVQDILKKKPIEIQDQEDWEWLVKNHFQASSFKEKSERNSKNRKQPRMPHRTGSKPMREIAYQMVL